MTDAWSALTGKFRSKDLVDYTLLWGLIALGVTALFSVILSVRGLWSLRRGQPQ